MANTLRFKRGLASGIPTALAGEPLFTTDTFDLYIGNGTTNTRFQKYIASGTTSQLLRGDGSLLTMPIVLTSPSNGQVLKYNGTSWVNDSDSGITGSGSAGQVAYFTGATTQAGNNALFWDTTNLRLGIGTVSPFTKLDSLSTRTTTLNSIASFNTMPLSVTDDTAFAAGVGGGINFRARLTSTSFSTYAAIWSFRDVSTNSDYKGSLIFGTANNTNGYPEEAMRIFSTRNVGINTGATDSGQRLQVIGTGYFSDSVGIGSTSLTGYNLRISNNITGVVSPIPVFVDGTIQSTATGTTQVFRSSPSVAASATISEIRHFSALQGTFGAGSSVSTQTGFFVHSGMTGASTDYGFYGDLAAATNVWNLYMNGTAQNYLAGNTGIGTTSITALSGYTTLAVGNATNGGNIDLMTGTTRHASWNNTATETYFGTRSNTPLAFTTNATEVGRFYANGNFRVGGNAADGGFRLDVTGTARFTDTINLKNGTTSSLALRFTLATTTGIYNFDDGVGANMILQANGVNNQLVVHRSGNIGVGLQPTLTSGGYRNVQNGNAVMMGSGSDAAAYWNANATFNSGWKYIATGASSRYEQGLGAHYWFSAASGTAGNAITFTQAMTLFSTNNLAIGSTTDSGERLQVTGTAKITGATAFGGNTTLTGAGLMNHTIVSTSTAGYSYMIFKNTGASGREMTLGIGGSTTGNDSNKFFIGDTTAGGAIRMIIDTSGNIGFGTYNPDARLRVVSASANSTQAIFGNVDGRGLLIATSQIAGTNDAGTILNARGASSGTFIFQTDGTQRVQIDSTGLIINGGNALEFINSAANAVSAIRPTGGGTSVMSTNSNGLHIAVGTEAAGDLILASNNTERVRLSSNGWFSHTSATNPSSSVTDSYVQYSADVTAGNAAPHFRTENGAVIKLYQETTAVGNSIISLGGGSAVLDDTTFDGYTLRQIVKALRNQGILA
jgi:hypothetical protein